MVLQGTKPDFRIRLAQPGDAPTILALIRDLADTNAPRTRS